MPAAKHVLVTFGGTFGTGSDAEIWQCGVKMGALVGGAGQAVNLGDLTGYVNSITGGLQTWFSTAANNLRNDFKLAWVKAANIGAGTAQNPYGLYAGSVDAANGPNPAIFSYGTPIAGAATTSAPVCAPQIITAALTWRNSTRPKGPRHSASHGRIYPPFAITSATERLGSVTGLVNSGKALLTALSKDSVPDSTNTLISLRPVLVGVDGTIAKIDTVSVGDVVDTVRRRKDKLRENYTSSAWA